MEADSGFVVAEAEKVHLRTHQILLDLVAVVLVGLVLLVMEMLLYMDLLVVVVMDLVPVILHPQRIIPVPVSQVKVIVVAEVVDLALQQVVTGQMVASC